MNRVIYLVSLVTFMVLCPVFLYGACSGGVCSVECTGDITSAMNTAINTSVSGDTIRIGAGSCTSGALNVIVNKAVNIIGAGQASTTITTTHSSYFIQIQTDSTASANWRISGFTLYSETLGPAAIVIWGNGATEEVSGWRIDHLTLNYPSSGADGMIAIYGTSYGLIDNCTFIMAREAAIMLSAYMNTEDGTIDNLYGSYNMSLPFTPGSSKAVYIEDCTFTASTGNQFAVVDVLDTGGRWVYRHNTGTNVAIYTHSSYRNSVNAMWFEMYNNKWIWNIESTPMMIRFAGGGTGVIYNNTFSGYSPNTVWIGEQRRLDNEYYNAAPLLRCLGTNEWDNNTDSSAPGWPCISQTGRDAGKTMAQIRAGTKQPSFPMYLWNNGVQDKCYNVSSTGDSCDNSTNVNVSALTDVGYFQATAHSTGGFGNGDVDYCINSSKPASCGTHTLTYTPYTYPHPLQGNTSSAITGCVISGGTIK